LITRLKHYENLLRKNGIDPNAIESDSYEDSVSIEGEVENTVNIDPVQASSDVHNQTTKGQFLSRGGKSIYFDKYGLSLLSFETEKLTIDENSNVWRNFGSDVR
jgi:hypothetical protein